MPCDACGCDCQDDIFPEGYVEPVKPTERMVITREKFAELLKDTEFVSGYVNVAMWSSSWIVLPGEVGVFKNKVVVVEM